MSAKDDGWHVGGSIFVLEKSWGKPRTYQAKVTKVGRKWVEFQRNEGWRSKDDRFDHESMRLDGGAMGWRGRVYADEAEYVLDCEIERAWTELVRSLPHCAPDHMTIDSISRVREMILGAEK